jgi:hypothetical protein
MGAVAPKTTNKIRLCNQLLFAPVSETQCSVTKYVNFYHPVGSSVYSE